jgi:nucleolar protein 4
VPSSPLPPLTNKNPFTYNPTPTHYPRFGFVQFALPEDAQRAVEELGGRTVSGRKLQLEVADKRAPLDQRHPKRAKEGEDPTADPSAAAAAAAAEPPPAKRPRPAPEAAPRPRPVPTQQQREQLRERQRQPRGLYTKDGILDGMAKARMIAVGGLPHDNATVQAAIAQVKAMCRAEVASVIDPAPPGEIERNKLMPDGCSGHVFFVEFK